MSEMALLVQETAARMFRQEPPHHGIRAMEAGGFDQDSWERFEASGFSDLLCAARSCGGKALDAQDEQDACAAALELLLSAGYRHVPLPVAETLAARTLAARAGLDLPEQGMCICVEGPCSASRTASGDHLLSMQANRLPWARHAAWLLVIARTDDGFAAGWLDRNAPGVQVTHGSNVAGEPRDDVRLAEVRLRMRTLPLPAAAGMAQTQAVPCTVMDQASTALRALCTAALMAGAAEAALDLSVRHAGERVQFGKPLLGFQAVQQQLAVLAGEVASARTACALAFAHPVDDDWRRIAIAKIRAGAAARVAAEVAHQVHGAIGITQEYPLQLLTRRLWSWRAENGAEAAWADRLGREVIARGGDRLWPDLVNLQPGSGSGSDSGCGADTAS